MAIHMKTPEQKFEAVKQVVIDCILYEQEEKEKMQELGLIWLREKHHYKMRAYQWILHEIERISGGTKK